MKIIQLILFLLIFSSCAVKRNSSENTITEKLSITINTEKTKFEKHGWVDLYVTFTNNSKEDIIILRSKSKSGYQIDFFNPTVDCDGLSLMSTGIEHPPIIERNKNELITIKAKSQIEIKVLGRLYELVCNEGNWINVKIEYNSNNLTDWIVEKYNPTQKQIIKDIYSKITKFKVQSSEARIELK
ncbi:hypothetical protein ACJRPK_17375 [Aquimarina sp. 2-A2]|uniref:hypothetical protein n=1 Tax=Aquimarina sp. 2-A2 TaxID=3382644 RepID=UPI00387EF91B